MTLPASPALTTPSRIVDFETRLTDFEARLRHFEATRVTAAIAAPAAKQPSPPRFEDTARLSPKQKERVERLMAAVRVEFDFMLAAERQKARPG